MEELTKRAKTMLVFDAYLKKTDFNPKKLKENYKEIESVLQIASYLGGGSEKNISHRIDITVAMRYSFFIYLKEDQKDKPYHIEKFKETIEEIKKRLNPKEVMQVYENAQTIAKLYEKEIQEIMKKRKKRKKITGKLITKEPKQDNNHKDKEKNKKEDEQKLPEKLYEQEINNDMIKQLRKLAQDINENPKKYHDKKKHKQYFKRLIKQHQKNLCKENITSLSLQEKNDAKFANNIEKLIHNMLRGWSGAKQELNEIKKEFDSEFYYDPARLMEYLGKEMIILKIITKDELPESMQ